MGFSVPQLFRLFSFTTELPADQLALQAKAVAGSGSRLDGI
jgi:hypothetical protein